MFYESNSISPPPATEPLADIELISSQIVGITSGRFHLTEVQWKSSVEESSLQNRCSLHPSTRHQQHFRRFDKHFVTSLGFRDRAAVSESKWIWDVASKRNSKQLFKFRLHLPSNRLRRCIQNGSISIKTNWWPSIDKIVTVRRALERHR